MSKMVNKNVKMIFFDIDETLIVKETQWLSANILQAFEKLREKGIKIAIATGRAKYDIPESVRALGADYYVTINGQLVTDNQETIIYENPLKSEQILELVNWCTEQQQAYGMVGAGETKVSEWTPFVATALELLYGEVPTDPLFYQKQKLYQMWTFAPTQNEDMLPAKLLEAVNVVRWHEHSCDVYPKNGSKANGIAQLLATLGIEAQEVMAFGDGLNDREMFDFVGFSVAMGNADPSLKEQADYVTKSVTEDGVVYGLTTLGLIDEAIEWRKKR